MTRALAALLLAGCIPTPEFAKDDAAGLIARIEDGR